MLKKTKINMKEALIKVIEKHKDFNFYQTIEYKGEILKSGIRYPERRKFIDLLDIKDKRILDIVASTAAESIWAIENGAKRVDCIERLDRQCLIISDFISEIKKIDKSIDIELHKWDLNNGLPTEIKEKEFDTIFCFAIIQYLGYKKIWRELKSPKVIYLETGADGHLSEDALSDEIYKAKKLGIIKETMGDKNYERVFYRIDRRV
jgi:16S rRNA G966 N2-methylase RsmD